MTNLDMKIRIMNIIIISLLLLGTLVSSVNTMDIKDISEKNTDSFQGTLQDSMNEPTGAMNQENNLNLAIQSSGIIAEGSDEFLEGTLENLNINKNGYLSLKKSTVNTWTNQTPASSPSGRFVHSMVFDSSSDLVILFGGADSSSNLADTWIYDLGTDSWTQQTPSSSPSARSGHSMVYDSFSDKMILFGGANVTFLNDTWVYDLGTDSWTQQTPSSSPSARTRHSMVYDSFSDKIILFGGFNGTYLNDTWVYDLTTNSWTQQTPSSSPSGRSDHSMIYDSSSGKVILFGGAATSPYDDTWVYSLETNTWTNQIPSSSPSARYSHSMVYDSSSGKVILFGGAPDPNEYYHDTWFYDLETNNWTNQIFSSSPIARNHHSMVYDSSSDLVILFGGLNVTMLGDTWFYPIITHIRTGIFESKLTYFGNIHNIAGGLTWNPSVQPVSTELKFQIGFSNTTKAEDFHYTNNYTSDFPFAGFARYLRYRATFESDNKQFISPLVKKVYVYYSIDPCIPQNLSAIPSIPQNLSAIAGDNFVSLSWTLPSDDGGSTITHYNVYRGTVTGEYMFLGIAMTTSFNDTLDLTETTYYYVVTAINAIGESDFSTEVSANPTVTSIPKTSSFPGLFTILIFLGSFVVFTRKCKKT